METYIRKTYKKQASKGSNINTKEKIKSEKYTLRARESDIIITNR